MEHDKVEEIIHIVTDQGNGAAICGGCNALLGEDPLVTHERCDGCGATLVGSTFYVNRGGSDFYERCCLPEGPECKIIAEGLDALMSGRTISRVEIVSGRYQRHGDPPGLLSFRELLPLRCEGVKAYGKFIYILTDGDASVWSTLGMTGRWSTKETGHTRASIEMDEGMGSAFRLFFDDARNFGTLRFSLDRNELAKKLSTLGFDPLQRRDPDFSIVKALVRKKDRPIVEALMDQRLFAGVGNYIKCEALYRSGISPHRTTGSLADDELESLLREVAHVMWSSYDARGHTMSDYRDVDGNEGAFKFKLLCYRQQHDPHGNPVGREQTSDGRTTHWVPAVQR